MTMPFSSSNTLSLYENLNVAQKKAVQALNGPVLILAGAGAGKTRVIVHRIAALIREKNINLQNILAVTFTNKAAREMRERALALLSGEELSHTPWIGTFHSVCAQILRNYIHLVPDRDSFIIYDDKDQLQLIKAIMKNLNINEKMHPPKNFKSQINLCKRKAVEPHEIHKIPHLFDDFKFEKVYVAYEKALIKASAFDFSSLLLETYKLMKNNPDFLKTLQDQFQYILVDEYQDTNHIQYLLIRKLAEKHKNICVVGDEDQSIYGWRGADITNIMSFEKDFLKTQVLFLEQNYRSSKSIVAAAGSVIAKNKTRKGKTLFTKNAFGEKILIGETLNEFEESRFIAGKIQALCSQFGSAWDDFAILYRINAQSRSLEDQLRRFRIPYKIVGGIRFYERTEIKDILAYLRLALNEKDDISFLRAINSPKRGIGKTTLEALQKEASQKDLFSTLGSFLQKKQMRGKIKMELQNFQRLIKKLQKKKNTSSLLELYFFLLEETGYLNRLKIDSSPEAQSRIANLQEFANVIEQRENDSSPTPTLEGFLEEMSLLSESDKTSSQSHAVTLMTLHNSKGLEFHSI
ncbi:MAG: UvrD-helicase domain-containing protein, partial [Bdellovibrionales bacterium]|nr:UvrD-helicase domain-containing protein [Bdellovibrionales bacterium]